MALPQAQAIAMQQQMRTAAETTPIIIAVVSTSFAGLVVSSVAVTELASTEVDKDPEDALTVEAIVESIDEIADEVVVEDESWETT